MENIKLADSHARCGKHNWGIKKHDEHAERDNLKLLESLQNLTYRTSEYNTFKIYEPKERVISRLPYYPDRIAQWAIMNVMESIWTSIFIKHTYSCIKERGIHKAVKDVKRALKQKDTEYCLKMDVKKFYPSIDHETMKRLLRRKLKDKKLLAVLDEIVESANGVPIGNYLSQFFANLYLTYFDHWMLEEVKVKHYFRYADDIVILSDKKEYLKNVLVSIKAYFSNELNIELKPNYQIFRVEDRGIDFIGYKFYHTHVLLRKGIKRHLFKLLNNREKLEPWKFYNALMAYKGWLKYCDSKHLLQTIEEKFGIHLSNWNGEETIISNFYDRTVRIYEIECHKKGFRIHFIYKNKPYYIFSKSVFLYNKLKDKQFPVNFKFKKYVRTKKK